MRITLIFTVFLLSFLYSYSSEAQTDSCLLQAQKIKKRLIKGESFCQLAREFSEDYSSLVVCGDLGYFKSGELIPEYEEATLKLKPGEIGIAKTHYGYHIIQLIQIKYDEDNKIYFDSRHILIKGPCTL
jgi:peptidyl-prolyl cis-trans isomerase SurA